MFKQEKTKIFINKDGSTIIIIDKSTHSYPITEFLALEENKGWVIHSENIPFNIVLIAFNKAEGWKEINLPEFNGEN